MTAFIQEKKKGASYAWWIFQNTVLLCSLLLGIAGDSELMAVVKALSLIYLMACIALFLNRRAREYFYASGMPFGAGVNAVVDGIVAGALISSGAWLFGLMVAGAMALWLLVWETRPI